MATWLHRKLENYRLPKKLLDTGSEGNPIPRRLNPVFRDQDELPASGSLGNELREALSNSLYQVVICSPASAKSKWVNEEIRLFKSIHGGGRVLALIVDGTPHASLSDDKSVHLQECFPSALLHEVDEDGNEIDATVEPIAADIRKDKDGRRLAFLKIAAGLANVKLDDLVQRDSVRRLRVLASISFASVASAIFAIGLALYANEQRMLANEQRIVAERESATANAVSNFLVSIFTNAKSYNTNPEDITARSILDNGANKLSEQLVNQRDVKGRLGTTIALAYNNLGFVDQAIAVLDSIEKGADFNTVVAHYIKAESLLAKGELSAALSQADNAFNILTDLDGDSIKSLEITADIYAVKARVFYKQADFDQSRRAFDRAIESLSKADDIPDEKLAAILQNRALLLSDMWELDQALSDLDRAKTLVLRSVGEQDILVGQISLAQAQVNYFAGNLSDATQQINTAIMIMQRIYDDSNPALADALSMKGQILYGIGEFTQAQSALKQAVKNYTQAFKGRHYLSGIAEVYLGLIAGDLELYETASLHFDEAELHYNESYGQIHANHGDLLVNRATVLAKSGEISLANQYCSEGMVILNDTLGEDASFTQQLQQVCNDIKLPNN